MKRLLLTILGSLALALGTIGMVLPVLPTTPFLLLALACFMGSNEKLFRFILTNKWLSPYVKDYMNGDGIPLKVKKRVILMIWLTIGFSVVVIIDQLFVRILLLTIASIVTTYIWTRRTANET